MTHRASRHGEHYEGYRPALLRYNIGVHSDLNDRQQPIAHLDQERKPNDHLTSAFEKDVVVRPRMLRKFTLEDGGDSANAAARVGVVFAGAHDPLSSSLLDVNLTRNMVVPEGHGWDDWYGVLHVGDALYEVGKNIVHEAREDLVPNPRHTVPDDDDDGG